MRYYYCTWILFGALLMPGVAFGSEDNGSIIGLGASTRVCQDTVCAQYGEVNWRPTITPQTSGLVGVSITDSGLTGHVWGSEIGWVTLNPTGAGVDIDPNTGALSGSAYANTGSWINFNPTDVSGNPDVGVRITESGQFSGWAYVSGIKGGWMQFDCAVPQTCIETDWRPISARGGSTSGGGGSSGSGGGGGTVATTSSPTTTTTTATTSVVVYEVTITYDADTSLLTVTWSTSEPTPSVVAYTTGDSGPVVVEGSGAPTTQHSITFDIPSDTLLAVSILSDPEGNITETEYTFLYKAESPIVSPFSVPPALSADDAGNDGSSEQVYRETGVPQGTSSPSGASRPEVSAGGNNFVEEKRTESPMAPPTGDGSLPLALALGMIGISALITRPFFVTARVRSVADVRLLMRRLWGVLFPRVKNNVEPWGTVYDSHTKQPLDPVYVSLRNADTHMEIDGVVTDMAGRYGFHVPPGRYTIVPVKTHYSFPSKSLFGQSSDIVYDKLYFGESITVRDTETAIIRNIPMDAQGVDWNEEEKVRLGFVSTRKRRQYIRFVFNTVSLVGVAYSVYAWVQSPHVWNTLILVSYAGIFTVTLLYTRHFKLATVQMRGRGPLSFARIKLFFTEHDILAKQVVADADGKFYLLVPPGAYRLVVEARNNVGEYVQKLNVRELRLPRGIFTHDIIVPRSALSNVD